MRGGRSGQKIMDDMPMHIRQSEIASGIFIRQFFMVQTKNM